MLNKDYKDILVSLLSEGAEFILVGAYALAAHGFPRATMDIDIWINPSPENAVHVYSALGKFGAPIEQISVNDLTEDDTIFQIGVAPRRIDILTNITGVDFEEAMKDAIKVDIEGITINILSTDHLIKNKLATGRPKDIDDVENLKKHLKG
jgi:predicted nucleotidyltransferase